MVYGGEQIEILTKEENNIGKCSNNSEAEDRENHFKCGFLFAFQKRKVNFFLYLH